MSQGKLRNCLSDRQLKAAIPAADGALWNFARDLYEFLHRSGTMPGPSSESGSAAGEFGPAGLYWKISNPGAAGEEVHSSTASQMGR
jgi:hypothetical protein